MKIFKTPFAMQGDRVAVPDEMQSDGSVSYTQGYSQDYEKEYDKAGAKDIERSKMNAIFHDITDAIGKGQSTGIYPWIKEAAPYAKGSFVYYNKEAFYSLVDNNSDTPTDGAKWRALSKKQDALTFTGSGDVVRKSVTDALDKRVATAQSSADSALKEAQSKQDKLEFVGSGKVMKEGAWGLGGFTQDMLPSDKTNKIARFRNELSDVSIFPNNHYYNGLWMGYGTDRFSGLFIDAGQYRSFIISQAQQKAYEVYTEAVTKTDKNGVLHATTSTPINTLNVSDMSQSVVNRDDITVTSGAVFRAIQTKRDKDDTIFSNNVGIAGATGSLDFHYGDSKTSLVSKDGELYFYNYAKDVRVGIPIHKNGNLALSEDVVPLINSKTSLGDQQMIHKQSFAGTGNDLATAMSFVPENCVICRVSLDDGYKIWYRPIV